MQKNYISQLLSESIWKRHLCGLAVVFIFLLSVPVFAQQTSYTISGTVTNKTDRTGLPAANISIKGTTLGTIANAQGQYTFTASLMPGTYELVFTYIGYTPLTQRITLGNQTVIQADFSVQESTQSLDEVIVTGSLPGTTKKNSGNFVATLKGSDVANVSNGSVLAGLQGKTPGAQVIQNSGDPAGGLTVRLRGISTITGSSEPLYIVDGVIIDNSSPRVTNASGDYSNANTIGQVSQNRMADINPNDIERIEVLNGASAAAIYGSRANAGVIQIFTKRGSTGKPVITFSSKFILSELRKKLPVNEAPFKFGPGTNVLTQDLISTYNRDSTGINYVDANGKLIVDPNTQAPVSILPNYRTAVQRYDYQDYIFQSATGTDNSIAIQGGKEDTKYYVGLSYFKNQGIVRNTDFTRYSMRVNLDQTINRWAKASFGLSYSNSESNEKPDGNTFFSPINGITIIGNFHDIQARDAAGNIRAIGERGRVNPVSIIEDIKQNQRTNRIIGNFKLSLTPIKNLSLDYNLGVDTYGQAGKTYIPPYAYNVSPGNYGGGATLDVKQNGYSNLAASNSFQINHDLSATYQAVITSSFTSTTQLGYQLQYQRSNLSITEGRGLLPGIQTVNNAATPLNPSDSRSELVIQGYFLQQGFKYKDIATLTIAGRIDGASSFKKELRDQFYKKFAFSFLPSELAFWKEGSLSQNWNFLKLRVAYGESGNLTGVGPYSRFNNYNLGAFLGNTYASSSLTLTNENIRQETQKEWEFGTDMSFFNNRIGLTANYYIKRVNDLYLSRQIAPSTGFQNNFDNIGALKNEGIEIALNTVPVKVKDFRWNLNIIYNRNRNTMTDVPQALIIFATNSGAPVALLKNQPVGVFYGSYYARNPDGSLLLTKDPQPLNGSAAGLPQQERGTQADSSPESGNATRDANGQPTPTATPLRRIIGDPNPKYTGSLINTFSFKRLTLNIQMDATQGNNVFNADYRTRQGVGNGKIAEAEILRQLPRGYINAVYPVLEFRIDDGSFVKLREVSLGYNFGSTVGGLSDLSLSISGRNLHSWDNYKGYDPETNAGGQSNLIRGVDFGNVPIPRTFQMAITAKF
jgi:TonB-linked SusC/RagA family outer membrane protein